MSQKCDYAWKILIVGNSGVGKSSVLLRFVNDEFKECIPATVGVDFKMKHLTVDDKLYKLAIWDTAGQERFRGLTSSYYRGADGVLLMYDVADRSSFEALTFWKDDVEKNCGTNPIFCVVGNKVDQRRESGVSTEEGCQFAQTHRCMFLETSAATNEGVERLFTSLATKLAANASSRAASPSISMNLEAAKRPESRFCPC